jgi:hypothetical protein
MNVMPEDTMTQYPYILFNKSPEQLRRLGALGGRAYGRNQRIRRALLSNDDKTSMRSTPHLPPCAVPQETAAKAIHLLDTQFPWLRGAERQRNRIIETGVPLSGSVSGR